MRKLIVFFIFCLVSIQLQAFSFKDLNPFKEKANDGVYFGLFREGAPREMYKIERFEQEYGFKPHIVMWYLDWKQPFSMEQCLKVLEYGAIPQIVWEPWVWGEFDAIRLKNIINGDWDPYITSFATDTKRFGYPIFIRILHEFNIEGYSWSLSVNDKDYDRYIKAYRHIVDIFRKVGAYNAYFVWCPMNYSYPDEPWNDYTKAYPGDDYVDWIGVDGYNWGTTQSWSQWQSFEILFREPVRILSRKYPTKPIMIAEFSSGIEGGDKAKWVDEIPYYLKTTLKQVKSINWFDIKKEADWRIKSPPEVVPAFKKMIKDPVFRANIANITNIKVNYANDIKKKKIDFKYAKMPLKIDTDIAKWAERDYVKIEGIQSVSSGAMSWTGNSDISARAQFSWDKDYFYCVFDITDDFPLNNKQATGNIWNGDGVELAISLDPDADKNRTSFTDTDFQIGLSCGDYINIKPSIWIYRKNKSPANAEIRVKPTKKGYIMEAKIAWKELVSNFIPKKGDKIGFTFAIDDADKTDKRESQILFSGDYLFYKDPSVWGEAILK